MAETTTLPFQAYAQTDRGLQRERNEDAFLALPKLGFFAVADGLGGLPEGALASMIAVERLQQCLTAPGRNGKIDFDQLFNFVNTAVHDEGLKVSEDVGIGTTLTAVKLNRGQLEVGHVGDSGLLLFRPGQDTRQLTTDHTMAEEMRARLRPGDNVYIPDYYTHTLTRCIGQSGEIEVDRFSIPVAPGDRLLLYTDGVTKVLRLDELNQQVWLDDSPEKFVERIVHIANQRGGPDNVTAIAIFF
ncbi:MAG: protein phosphatase 2C domain-containing protein [Opitutales bacterium]|jgi:protein phosphatase